MGVGEPRKRSSRGKQKKRKKRQGKKSAKTVWQQKELEELDKTAATLANLALNPQTSDADFYRAAVYEAINTDQRRVAREKRALAAGIRVAGHAKPKGVEVLTKDTVSALEAKRLGHFQLSLVLGQCKKHKALVDTAKASIDNKLEQRWKRRLSGGRKQPRDQHPGFNFPLSLKNFASRRQVESWNHTRKKLDRLVRTAQPRIDTKPPESRKRLYRPDMSDVRPGEYHLSAGERKHWRLHLQQLQELVETAPTRVDDRIDEHTERIWELERSRGQEVFPEYDFPLTLKREATLRVVKGWRHFATSIKKLCKDARPRVETDWGIHGPPRSSKRRPKRPLPAPDTMSRGATLGSLPSRPSSAARAYTRRGGGSLPRPKSMAGLRGLQSLQQMKCSHVPGLQELEGLELSFSYFLGGQGQTATSSPSSRNTPVNY